MRSLARPPRPTKPLPPLAAFVQSMGYVEVKMRWKKDASFDAVPVLAHARDLRPLAALARLLSPSPTPVSAVSKLRRSLETSDRRREERDVFAARRADITSRLRRLLLMSPARRLPLTVAQGMLWHLGIPEDYFKRPDFDIGQDGFRILTTGDAVFSEDENHGKELGLIDDGKDQEMPLSVLQMGAIRRFGSAEEVPFPLFPSKGLRLKRKIGDWMEGFQKLPYISPYADFSNIHRGSDVSEKRAVGVLHELFSLFVTCSAERRRLLCLRTHLGLSQKVHLVFERHPHIFYLLLKEKTCFAVLKEAYMAGGHTSIEEHPMLEVRSKYARLMQESQEIIRRRRSGKPVQLDPEDQESEDSKGINSAAIPS
uniref:PORR domain-containing protein n=1 Tax=Aegilops tauschii TaxID=37682 RepID=R7VZ50_AEGTA